MCRYISEFFTVGPELFVFSDHEIPDWSMITDGQCENHYQRSELAIRLMIARSHSMLEFECNEGYMKQFTKSHEPIPIANTKREMSV